MPLLSFVGLVALLLTGFAMLAMSQDQHRRAVGVRPLALRSRTACRTAAYLLLSVALPISVWRDGPGFGTLIWMMLLSVSACTVTLMLAWKPEWLAPFAKWNHRS